MIHRHCLPGLILLLSACAIPGGGPGPGHDPSLRLSAIARGSDTDGRLFTRYNPRGPSTWNQGWPWKLDLSGVAWDEPTTATALTPRHVVMADHFKRGIGGRVVFHNRDGRAIERFVEKIISFRQVETSGDIAVGLLNRPLPASIRTYAVPAARADYASSLPGATALVTDQFRALFFHQIAGIRGSTLQFRHDPASAPGHRKNLIIGDSGNPSFLLSHGELVLIETHTAGGPGSGPFYGAPDVVTTLRRIIATLDPTYSLRTVAIDARTVADASAARTALQSASGGGAP